MYGLIGIVSFILCVKNAYSQVTISPDPACKNGQITITVDSAVYDGIDSIKISGQTQNYLLSTDGLEATITTLNTDSASVTVVVFGQKGAAMVQSTLSLVVIDLSGISITPATDTGFCQGEQIIIRPSINNTALLNYEWYSGNNRVATTTDLTLSHQTNLGTSPVPYYLRISLRSNGACIGISDTVQVTYYPVVTAEAGSDIRVCEGTPITIGPSTNVGRCLWTLPNNSTDSDCQLLYSNSGPSQSGKYLLTLTANTNRCSDRDSVNVEVRPYPIVSDIITTNPTSCVPNGSIEIRLANGGNFTFDLNAGQTTPTGSWTGLPAANYEIRIRYPGGPECSVDTPVSLISPDVLQVSINADGETTFCEGGSVDLHPIVSGGVAPYRFSWSVTGTSDSVITVTNAGNYRVTVLD